MLLKIQYCSYHSKGRKACLDAKRDGFIAILIRHHQDKEFDQNDNKNIKKIYVKF